VNALKIREFAGFADEEAEIGAFCGQGFGYVMADKTGCACEENVHRRAGQQVSELTNERVADAILRCGAGRCFLSFDERAVTAIAKLGMQSRLLA
jgi:hypothetical protein